MADRQAHHRTRGEIPIVSYVPYISDPDDPHEIQYHQLGNGIRVACRCGVQGPPVKVSGWSNVPATDQPAQHVTESLEWHRQHREGKAS